MKAPVPLERQIHLGVCRLLTLNARPGIVWFHTANERRTTPRQGAFLKRMGVKAGVPDFVILTPEGACFLEIKRPGKSLSLAQKTFFAAVYTMGYEYGTAQSIDDAVRLLKGWNVLPSHRAAPQDKSEQQVIDGPP